MTWEPYRAEDYVSLDELERWCQQLAKAYPEWVRLESIGESRQGRSIWLLTLGDAELDPHHTPAVWVDAGTHASEWCGVSAALFTTSRWIERLTGGEDPELEDWFSNHLAFVIPCISPDGYQALFDGAPYLRSTLRPPRHDEPRQGFEACDMTGDGAVRWMRFKHPAGALVDDPDVPMFMRPRTLDDDPADAYFLCDEGQFIEWDGSAWAFAPLEFGVDLNRNFPSHWAPFSMFGMDAGAYSLSEPEARAVVDAFEAHQGISAALTNHTYTGCVLTQPYRQDSPLSQQDINVMHALAMDLVEGTDYDVYKVCPDFMYDPKKPTVGVWSDTMSTVFGVPGYTVEFWNPYGFAGVSVEKPAAFFMNPDARIIRAMLEAFGKIPGAVIDWQPFEHPQLGEVEVGGIDYLRTIRNPPVGLLARECEKGFKMSERIRAATPEVVSTLSVRALGDGLHEVRLELENLGFLSTCGLRRAIDINASPSVNARLEVAGGVELVDETSLRQLDHMSGWGELRTGNAKHMIYAALPTPSHRSGARWLVRGEGSVTVKYRAGRAGLGEHTQEISIS
jgi:hypothetical protein